MRLGPTFDAFQGKCTGDAHKGVSRDERSNEERPDFIRVRHGRIRFETE